jgi:glutathione peroxidase
MLSGLEILAFPCNQFLNQEPGTSEDAQNFACTMYKADYPIFHKVMNGLGLVIAMLSPP